MLRPELITTGNPPNCESVVRSPSLLNPTSTEPDQMRSNLIRRGTALLVQLRCLRISDKQEAGVKDLTTGTAFMAQPHLGVPKPPW